MKPVCTWPKENQPASSSTTTATARIAGLAKMRFSKRSCVRLSQPGFSDIGSFHFAKSINQPASNGTAKAVSSQEANKVEAMVSDSALKNAPVTPVRKPNGAKTISVAAEDPVSGLKNSEPARSTQRS